MNVLVTCKGTRPLLMHNAQLASPLNAYAKAMKSITGKRKKTDEDHYELAKLEFEGGLYFDPPLTPKGTNNGNGLGPYIPVQNLYKSLIEGARIIRLGKAIERGVAPCGFMLPLIYEGPRTVKELWGKGESKFVDIRSAGVSRNRVDRCRPIFNEWIIEGEFIIDPKVIDFEQFAEAARLAGQMVGIGDYRMLYGRYEATCKQI